MYYALLFFEIRKLNFYDHRRNVKITADIEITVALKFLFINTQLLLLPQKISKLDIDDSFLKAINFYARLFNLIFHFSHVRKMIEVIRTLISRHLQQDLIDTLGPEKKKSFSLPENDFRFSKHTSP